MTEALGTFGMTGENGITAITAGIRNGYRLLDTAEGYGNEAEVGEAIRRSDVPTAEIIVTTKINGKGHGYDAARRSIEQSRRVLGVEQIGLHLIHWPTPSLNKYVDTWKALISARADGEVRSIGVSNFTTRYLTPIIDATGVVPAVNQIELHPHFPQEEQRRADEDYGICTQSWSPLGRGRELLTASAVTRPAARANVSPAQVVLRWHHQLGAVPIPRSSNPQRQAENLQITGFELSGAEKAVLTALGTHGSRLWDGDPDTVAFL